MNKKIFFNIVIQLLTFIRYGLIALTGLIMLALLILLIGGKPIQNSLQLDVPLPIIVIILIISILLVSYWYPALSTWSPYSKNCSSTFRQELFSQLKM